MKSSQDLIAEVAKMGTGERVDRSIKFEQRYPQIARLSSDLLAEYMNRGTDSSVAKILENKLLASLFARHLMSNEFKKYPTAESDFSSLIFEKDISAVKELIANGYDVNVATGEALRRAVEHNQIEIVKLLYENGATNSETMAYFGDGWHCEGFALVKACEENFEEIALFMIEREEDLDCDGGAPLYFAAKNSNLKLVRALLNKGARVYDSGEDEHSYSYQINHLKSTDNKEILDSLKEHLRQTHRKDYISEFASDGQSFRVMNGKLEVRVSEYSYWVDTDYTSNPLYSGTVGLKQKLDILDECARNPAAIVKIIDKLISRIEALEKKLP